MAPHSSSPPPQCLSPLLSQRFKGAKIKKSENYVNGRGTSSCGAALASALLKSSSSAAYSIGRVQLTTLVVAVPPALKQRPSSPLPNQYVHHSHCGWCDLWRSLQAVSRVFGGVFKLKVGSGGARHVDKCFAGTAVSGSLPDSTRTPFGTVPPYYAVWICRAAVSLSRLASVSVSALKFKSSKLKSARRYTSSFSFITNLQRRPRSPWARFL
ncbi:hypothetical protein R3P38DRAFT_3288490 [Favolaschia claudopus]|uniref:Uncharacterized protein n=1 Tax=Favolaschia claudopus TaxID=2862362 RepID=A0AAV9ZX19_9AGAR